MPRTGGVYSPPAGTKGVPNTTIQSVPYNTLIEDLTADANAPRPVTAGGTGATSASAARTALGVEIGTNVQAYDAGLQSIAGQTTVANQILYTTATDVYATTALTPFARTILDDADAATMRATLGLASIAASGSANDLVTGTIADARLPTSLSGKTFTSAVTAASLLTTAANQGIELGPAGIANTPFIDFHSSGANTDYDARILASGGSGATGNGALTYTSHGGHNFQGLAVFNSTGTFGGTLAGNQVITTNGEFIAKASGDRLLWFRTPTDVNRGLVYHQNSTGSLRLSLFNTSGVFSQELGVYEDGRSIWSGHVMRVGGAAASGEFQIFTNDTTDSYRMIGDNGGGLFIQKSNDRFGTNATTLMSWNAAGETDFFSTIYCNAVVTKNNGNGLNVKIGDDAWVGDLNASNSIRVWGQQAGNAGWIRFGGALNGFGVDAGSPDVIRYAGWLLQTDGNQYMPWAGLFLHQLFEQKAGIYTGSNRDETNFPIGHVILVETGNADVKERNSAHAIYLNSSYGYGFGGAGAQLAGTWRARGGYDSPGSGAWTYSFVRTA
ncbi:hypothetical protein [Ensifer adhaerens]|uniref:hypothetical protein n=1 Tax=Ensifer adhaerens TaxID=106592 RepID=UPI001F41BB2B|nr:hypothetical protein [Ensifer adhaerens]